MMHPRQKLLVFCWIALALTLQSNASNDAPGKLQGQTQNPALELLRRADQALDSGLAHALLDSLRSTAKQHPSQEIRTLAAERFCRAALQAGRPGEALQVIEEATPGPRTDFWRAQTLLALSRFAEAAEIFRQLLLTPEAPLKEESQMGLARALVGLRETSEAKKLLSALPPVSPLFLRSQLDLAALQLSLDEPEAAKATLAMPAEIPPDLQNLHIFLLASAEMKLGNPESALRQLSALPRSASETGVRASLLEADAHLALGRPAEALKSLEQLLSAMDRRTPPEVFLKLEEVLAADPSASSAGLKRLSEAEALSKEPSYATFFQARSMDRNGARREAMSLLAFLIEENPSHPIASEARVLRSLLLLKEDGPEHALAALSTDSDSSPEARFAEALAEFKRQNYERAGDLFFQSSSHAGLRQAGIYNAALSWEIAGIPRDRNRAAAELFHPDFPEDLRHEFLLSAALREAGRRSPQAGELLRELIPALQHRAALPLAEWQLIQGDSSGASSTLESVPDLQSPDRTAYLEILVADDGQPGGESRAMSLARSFLNNFPDSALAPEVRLKLAEVSYRNGDFLSASTELASLAADATDPALAAHAWFLAARASSRLMSPNALDQAFLQYEEAAEIGGDLEHRARFEQALLLTAQGEPGQALILLERVANSADPDLRAAALIEKGDTLFADGPENPDNYRNAIAVWKRIPETQGVSAYWAAQAKTKIGVAKENLGEIDAALESFYDVLLSDSADSNTGFWPDKAGFEAGRILEEKKSWNEALKVYDLIAKKSGPRAKEAALKANRLRLENFLWEE